MTKNDYKKVLEAKKKAKEELYKKYFPETKTGIPLLMIFGPSKLKEEKLLLELLEGVIVLPLRVIIVSENEPADALKHPAGHITWINKESGRNDPEIDGYLEAADFALVFDEHHEDLIRLMKKGVVVVGHEISPMLEDYHPNEETGNAFTFSSYNPWEMFRALVRATETYRFPFDWQNIIRGIFRKK